MKTNRVFHTIAAALIAVSMILSLTACGAGSSAQAQSAPTAAPQTAAPVTEPTAAPAANEPEEATMEAGVQEESGSKTLIVFFSRTGENYNVGTISTGNTAIVAELIAESTGADLFEIVPVVPYPDNYNDCLTVATREQRDNARPEYVGDVENWADYDTVFFGYPIWWGDLPMIAYTFLEGHDWSGKTVIPFNTHEGSGQGGTQRTVESLCAGATVLNGLAIQGKTAQNNRDAAQKSVNDWLDGLGFFG